MSLAWESVSFSLGKRIATAPMGPRNDGVMHFATRSLCVEFNLTSDCHVCRFLVTKSEKSNKPLDISK
jgi:hypothetical protein